MLNNNLQREIAFPIKTTRTGKSDDREKFMLQYQLTKSKLEHYEEICENIPIGCLKLNHAGFIEEANRLASQILGKDKKSLINRRFDLLIDPDDRNHLGQCINEARSSIDPHHFDLKLCKKGNHHPQIRVICFVKANSDKIFVTFSDITAQKKAEEDLKIAAVTFESQEAIAITDEYRSILKVNHAFTRLTGYTSDEVVDQTTTLLRAGVQNLDFYENKWRTVAKQGYWQGENWEKRKNGEIYPTLVTLTAVKDDNGKITNFVRFSRDISAEKQAEKVLMDSYKDLEDRMLQSINELEKIKAERHEVNAALNILLKRRETEKNDAQMLLLQEIDSYVKPFLSKLKNASVGRKQSTRLLSILENNLEELTKSYGVHETLPATIMKLTTVEKQVASMIRQGLSTKEIASTLNSSSGTVNIHRKNIRKKLGLCNQGTNLQSYLGSLTD